MAIRKDLAPLIFMLLAAAVVYGQQSMCPIDQLDQFTDIGRVCCESSTGAADCSSGFPATCTHACAQLLEPFWTACGSLAMMLGDIYTVDETAIDHFAKGQCHQTNVLFEHAAAAGSTCTEEMLAAMTDDVNSACCEQSGAYQCAAGTPWSCDATCALEFVPFWESCILGSGALSGSHDLASFATLYSTCAALPLSEDRLLIRMVNDLVNDPWCRINTTQIISIDAASAACTVDRSGFCERTIQSGIYSCDVDYCDTCGAQAHACDHTCGFPCVGQGGAIAGPLVAEVDICDTDSVPN